ncbi:hypothetical protein K2Y11_06735 [bacterium]|nr:hypothetical protein [bacterium]
MLVRRPQRQTAPSVTFFQERLTQCCYLLAGRRIDCVSIRRFSANAGFTIFELVLVIGIVSVLMAMAWPAFDQLFAARQLPESANELRTFLRDARRQAMADGVVYRCDFVPDTARIRMVPATDPYEGSMTDEQMSPEVSASSAPSSGAGSSGEAEVFIPTREEKELSGMIHVIEEKKFEEGPPAKDSEAAALENVEKQVEVPADQSTNDSATKWVPLAAFYPDGSATPTTIRLVDPEDHFIEIWVAALTGEVTIGESQEWKSEEQIEKEKAEENVKAEASR